MHRQHGSAPDLIAVAHMRREQIPLAATLSDLGVSRAAGRRISHSALPLSWTQLSAAHTAAMSEAPLFIFKVEPDPLRETRFRWTIREGIQIRLRSPRSYATKEEATFEAEEAIKQFNKGDTTY